MEDSSPQSFINAVKEAPVVKFNSADMPPPSLGRSPRRPLSTLRIGIVNRSMKVGGEGELSKFGSSSPKPEAGTSVITSTQSKDGETEQVLSPKKNRIVKMARRLSATLANYGTPGELQTISETDSLRLNIVTHDLGVPPQVISLFSQPVKCSPSDILTSENGKENALLRSGVRTLSLEETASPRKDFKRLRLMRGGYGNIQKRGKCVSNDDALLSEPRSVLRPSNLKIIEGNNFSELQWKELVTPEEASSKLFRSQSESAVSIMQAVAKSESDPLLIGDCSSRYVLPITEDGGRTSDLKKISGQTLCALLEGEYKNVIHQFDIIDCRYPYEFDGGHIKGALNIHTQKQLHEKYLEGKLPKPSGSISSKRCVIIFHCEFSSQRGPEMCRFMRGADRECNMESFPSLHYPELYVLQGGYKAFFENHQEHCIPCLYTPMADPGHAEEFKVYRSKSKTELHKSISSNQMKVVRRISCKKFEL